MPIRFKTDSALIDRAWHRALDGLRNNIAEVAGYRAVTVAPGYPGVWLEHAPHEGLLYADIDLAVAISHHDIFIKNQRENGQLACYYLKENHSWPHDIPIKGFGQVQSVVALALTGYELWRRTKDNAFASRLYDANKLWDAWLARHRDSERRGLVQAFCVFDTGHDNSWRFGRPPQAVPNSCPKGDATRCNEGFDLPWYAPDLSASRVELRLGLAALARRLGLYAEAEQWRQAAEESRQSLRAYLYDADDAFFYDRDSRGDFRPFRTEAALHPLRVGALPQEEFERMWHRHLGNPRRFWMQTPFPSVAVDDAAFNPELPGNCWGGNSQALTALRAPLWMERYGRAVELGQLLARWRDLLAKAEEFRQEANPFTGVLHPHTTPNYSASLFLLIDAVQRLHGIHRHSEGELAWNCRLPPGATVGDYELEAPDVGKARLVQREGAATLILNEKVVGVVRGVCRVRTDFAGNVKGVDATERGIKQVTLNGRDVMLE